MADNDKQVIKMAKKIIKKIMFDCSYIDKKVYTAEEGNTMIRSAILSNSPFAVGRLGAVEARCVSNWLQKKPYSDYNYKSIKEAAGFFPNNKELIDQFCEVYTDALRYVDAVAVWGVKDERNIIEHFSPSSQLIDMLSLEPYFYNAPWSSALEGKSLLIIHPFTESIKFQLRNNKEKLFRNRSVLPSFFKVEYVKAVQSNGDATTEFNSWFDALDSMKKQISNVEFDVAIIGAGAYGLPLTAYCKQQGKVAIQMAGATQLLFGVRGKRWDSRPEYMKYINEYWIRPNESEKPSGSEKVEGGTYW